MSLKKMLKHGISTTFDEEFFQEPKTSTPWAKVSPSGMLNKHCTAHLISVGHVPYALDQLHNTSPVVTHFAAKMLVTANAAM